MRIAVVIALACELVYVAAANLVLQMGLLEHFINANPRSVEVHFRRAWTILPGRINVREFSLRNQDDNIQFLLTIERAEVHVALFELLQRRFHATKVRAQGTRFLMRNRLEKLAGSELRVAAYPSIPGLADPPMKPLPRLHHELGSHPVTVHLENVEAGVSELWILEYRYSGVGHARGAFRLTPGQRLRVWRSELELEPGAFFVGPRELIASDVKGALQVVVDDSDVRRLGGWRVFDPIFAKGSLAFQLVESSFTRLYLQNPKAPQLAQGTGPVRLSALLDHGQIEPGSRFEYRTERLDVRLPMLSVRGDAEVTAAIRRDAGRVVGSVAISGQKLDIAGTQGAEGVPSARLSQLFVELGSEGLRVADEWRMTQGRIDIPELDVPDLRILQAIDEGERELRISGGASKLSAHGRLEPSGALSGEIGLGLARARFALSSGFRLDVSGRASARIQHESLESSAGAVSDITIDGSPTYIWTKDGSTKGGSLRLERGSLRYGGRSPPRFHGLVHARFPDADPVLKALGVHLGTLPKLAESVIDTSNLRATLEVAKLDRMIDVRVADARTNGLSSRGRWRKEGNHTRGAFVLSTSLVNVGVKLHDSETSVTPFVSDGWLDETLAEIGMRAASVSKRRPFASRSK